MSVNEMLDRMERSFAVTLVVSVYYLVVCRITEVMSFIYYQSVKNCFSPVLACIMMPLCTVIILKIRIRTLLIIVFEFMKKDGNVIIINAPKSKSEDKQGESYKKETTASTEEDIKKE